MNTGLNIVKENILMEADRQEIDEHINRIISKHKNNRYEINKLVFESVSTLTISDNYSNQLASQGILKRFWGGVTGKNRQLQNKIDQSLAASQYASQKTLEKLAEQNLMSFELITSVNNKLNSSIIQIENEINNVYATLVTFFKKSKSDIIQLENRVERLERNVSLLNWQNSIEYQMYDGIEYTEWDDVTKLVCLVRDFYDITKANWTTSDLLLLKTAMSTIGIAPKETISYWDFIDQISENKQLLVKLFDGIILDGLEKYPEYIAMSAGIEKRQLLETKEKYIVDNTAILMKKHGCVVEKTEIRDEMLKAYEVERAQIDLDKEISNYDLVMEILYNLEQIKEIQYVETLDVKMQEAKMLYSYYETEKLVPLLEQLVSYGYAEAKYMLAMLYLTGCKELEPDLEKADELLLECVDEEYAPAAVEYVIPVGSKIKIKEDKKNMICKFLPELKRMAQAEDMFAAQEYARCCINFVWLGIEEENDYDTAIAMYEKAPAFYKNYGLARRYKAGQGVPKDAEKSFELVWKSAELGYSPAVLQVGFDYYDGYGVQEDEKRAYQYYQEAYNLHCIDAIAAYAECYMSGTVVEKDERRGIQLFQEGVEKGNVNSLLCMGAVYREGCGVDTDIDKAIQYFEKAAKLGIAEAAAELGWIFLDGKQTITKNLEKAKSYFQMAAELGDEKAKEKLKELNNEIL